MEKRVTLKNRLGLHARSAAKIVSTASKFKSKVSLVKGDDVVDAKSILGILFLASGQGESLLVRTEGPDEEAALAALEALVNRRFDEAE